MDINDLTTEEPCFDLVFGVKHYDGSCFESPALNIYAEVAQRGVVEQISNGPMFYVKARPAGSDLPWVTYRAKPAA